MDSMARLHFRLHTDFIEAWLVRAREAIMHFNREELSKAIQVLAQHWGYEDKAFLMKWVTTTHLLLPGFTPRQLSIINSLAKLNCHPGMTFFSKANRIAQDRVGDFDPNTQLPYFVYGMAQLRHDPEKASGLPSSSPPPRGAIH